jgi:hypothetical protein
MRVRGQRHGQEVPGGSPPETDRRLTEQDQGQPPCNPFQSPLKLDTSPRTFQQWSGEAPSGPRGPRGPPGLQPWVCSRGPHGLQDTCGEHGGSPLPSILGAQEVPASRQGGEEEVEGAHQVPSTSSSTGEVPQAQGAPTRTPGEEALHDYFN